MYDKNLSPISLFKYETRRFNAVVLPDHLIYEEAAFLRRAGSCLELKKSNPQPGCCLKKDIKTRFNGRKKVKGKSENKKSLII